MAAIPITAFYAGLLGLLLLWLSLRVVLQVRAKEVSYGDAGRPEFTIVLRAQGNFIEYVPLILILMAANEMGGVSGTWLHVMGLVLVVARIMHPLGLTVTPGVNPLRFLGTLATWIVLLVASVLAIVNSF